MTSRPFSSVLALLCGPCIRSRRSTRRPSVSDPDPEPTTESTEHTPLLASSAASRSHVTGSTAHPSRAHPFAQPSPPSRHDEELVHGILSNFTTPLLPVPNAARDRFFAHSGLLSTTNSVTGPQGLTRSRLDKSSVRSSRSPVLSNSSHEPDDAPAPRSAPTSAPVNLQNDLARRGRMTPQGSTRPSRSPSRNGQRPISGRAYVPVRSLKLTVAGTVNVLPRGPLDSGSYTIATGTHRSSRAGRPSDSLSCTSAAAARASMLALGSIQPEAEKVVPLWRQPSRPSSRRSATRKVESPERGRSRDRDPVNDDQLVPSVRESKDDLHEWQTIPPHRRSRRSCTPGEPEHATTRTEPASDPTPKEPVPTPQPVPVVPPATQGSDTSLVESWGE